MIMEFKTEAADMTERNSAVHSGSFSAASLKQADLPPS